jgi:hypothetical protein
MSLQEEEAMMNVTSEAGPSTPRSLISPLVPGARTEGISKNQQKKINRKVILYKELGECLANDQERMLAGRPEKRAAERARKRERDAQRKEGYAAGTLTAEELDVYEKRKAMKKARTDDGKKAKKEVWKGGVIIDLGFDDMMRDPVSRARLCYCVAGTYTDRIGNRINGFTIRLCLFRK